MKRVLQSFLKIGAIGFGGGSALIPVVEAEVVELRGYLTQQRYAEHTILSNITPGALPVKLGMLAGRDMAGVPGMLAGAYAVALPGTVLTVLLLSLMSALGQGAVRQIEYASVGISAFILFLLAEYIHKVLRSSKKAQFLLPALCLMLFAAAATCGKELRALLTLLLGAHPLWSGAPLLDLSTIDLLVLAFFVILFTGGRIRSGRMAFAAAASLLYVLLFGKGRLLGFAGSGLLQLLLLALGIFMTARDARGSVHALRRVEGGALCRQVLAFVGLIALCALPAYLLGFSPAPLLTDGAFSVVTSFGGGEAYLTVADGLFVATGQVDASVFYGQIVPVANALPGPILVKMLAGIGYMLGFSAGGPTQGYAGALLGLAIGVGCTCAICLLAGAVYQRFAGLAVFEALRLWILPVICGLLLSTMLSMLGEMLKVSDAAGAPHAATLPVVCVLLLAAYLGKKRGIRDVLLILGSAAATIALLNLV